MTKGRFTIYNEINEDLISRIVKRNKFLKDRCNDLLNHGFTVRRCYIPTYNRLMGKSIVNGEIRITIGRPTNHFCREVYAVILHP